MKFLLVDTKTMMIKPCLILMSIFFLNDCSKLQLQKKVRKEQDVQQLIEPPSSFIATTSDYQTAPIPPNSLVIGYLIDGYTPTNAQFNKMTHIVISFLRATNSSGDITITSGWSNLREVVSAAHANNVKAIISFGGGGFTVTSKLMGVKSNRQNLINNIIEFIKIYNFDGFDCDWEPSWIDDKVQMEAINNSITYYYLTFIQEFRKALDKEFGKGNKTFSAAILNKNSIWYSPIKKISHFPNNGWWNYLDWVSLMNYDNDLGPNHATYESVFGKDGSLNYWIKFGIPETKIVTGLPFYGRAGWGEDWLFYKDIFKIDPMMADDVDFINYSKDGHSKKKYGFNNVGTVRKKVAKNKELMLPGIMFWQLDGDLPPDHRRSLLRAIDNELKK